MIVGAFIKIIPHRSYRNFGIQVSSVWAILLFIDNYIEPLLDKLSTENKLCSLMGDFNIDLLKKDSNVDELIL